MKLLSKIANMTFTKKVDIALQRILEAKNIKAVPVIIVFNVPVDEIIQSRLKRLGLKIKYVLPFMNALSGSFLIRNIENLVGMLEVKKIYHDGIAFLMASDNKELKDIADINYSKSYLNGKGVTIAFIDSGVYPHPDLIKPRNRISAFRDFINQYNNPYDDNGHGTACIGIAAGASMDGRFMSPAYDANIVCAKAFNQHGIGFFSDILGAMSWILEIKDQYNIKILALPFGTNTFQKDFDILSLACERLWEQNLFIITSSGNFGPNECSITSPGVSPYAFTVAGMEIIGSKAATLDISGRGPTVTNIEKPDCIMPGKNIPSLNTDPSFIPSKYKSYVSTAIPILYTSVTGTSASVALAAGDVALLYQKLPNIAPETAKGILKKCCISVNFLKTIQGFGMISIKNIEELPSPEHK